MEQGRRLRRLVKLIGMLQEERGQTLAALVKAAGAGVRPVGRDLKVLRSAGVRVEFIPEKQRYLIPIGAIGVPRDLTAEQVLAVTAITHSIGRYPHAPLYESLRAAMVKLQQALPSSARRQVLRMS